MVPRNGVKASQPQNISFITVSHKTVAFKGNKSNTVMDLFKIEMSQLVGREKLSMNTMREIKESAGKMKTGKGKHWYVQSTRSYSSWHRLIMKSQIICIKRLCFNHAYGELFLPLKK